MQCLLASTLCHCPACATALASPCSACWHPHLVTALPLQRSWRAHAVRVGVRARGGQAHLGLPHRVRLAVDDWEAELDRHRLHLGQVARKGQHVVCGWKGMECRDKKVSGGAGRGSQREVAGGGRRGMKYVSNSLVMMGRAELHRHRLRLGQVARKGQHVVCASKEEPKAEREKEEVLVVPRHQPPVGWCPTNHQPPP
eukprot:366227-Chlamydomonas_euryale.AAC.28